MVHDGQLSCFLSAWPRVRDPRSRHARRNVHDCVMCRVEKIIPESSTHVARNAVNELV